VQLTRDEARVDEEVLFDGKRRVTPLEVAGDTTSLPRGLTLQLKATGHYDDGSTRDLTTSCAWASADSMKATVNAAGLVTGVELGTVEVRALKSGVTGTVGLLIKAKQESVIATVRPLLDALDANHFRISDALRTEALKLAGE
jgi:hypothetical protein